MKQLQLVIIIAIIVKHRDLVGQKSSSYELKCNINSKNPKKLTDKPLLY